MRGLYRRRKIWWFAFTLEGTRHFVSTGEECEARAILVAREIRANPHETLEGVSQVESLLKSYLAEKERRGISPRWREDEGYALRSFFDVAGVAKPRDITTPKVTAWLDSKGERTAEQYLAILSRFARWLVAKGKLRENPCDAIPRAKKRAKARRRFLSRDECDRLLAACECPDLRAAVMLALHAGLRKGEVLAAKWAWVDLRAGLLHVEASEDWQPKDRDNRTIPLSRPLAEFLASRCQVHELPWQSVKSNRHENESFFVLPHSSHDGAENCGTALTAGRFIVRPEKESAVWRNRWEFRKEYAKALKAAGLEGVTFHDLRRTFASLHVSAGTSVYKVAKWLGDGVAVVERHYGHLSAADDEINRAWS